MIKDIICTGVRDYVLRNNRTQENYMSEYGVIDINDCIDRMLKIIRPILLKKILIIKDYNSCPLLFCHCQGVSFAILSLIMNAERAIDTNGAITITTMRDYSNKDDCSYIKIIISDTGIGIPRDKLDHIFEKINKCKNDTGITLPKIRDIISGHGGTLVIESELHAGTTVTISLPEKSISLNSFVANRWQSYEKRSIFSRNNFILAIGDDRNELKMIRESLNSRNRVVLTAERAESALVILQHFPVDMVICNIVMPEEMNGIEFLKKIKQDFPGVVTILQATCDELPMAVQAMYSDEICKVVLKPWTADQLKMVVINALDSRRIAVKSVRESDPSTVEIKLERLEQSYPGIAFAERDEEGSVVIPAQR